MVTVAAMVSRNSGGGVATVLERRLNLELT